MRKYYELRSVRESSKKHCSILKVLEDFKEKLEKKEEPETLAVKC